MELKRANLDKSVGCIDEGRIGDIVYIQTEEQILLQLKIYCLSSRNNYTSK